MNKPETPETAESPFERRFLAALRDIRAGRDPHDTLVTVTAALTTASKNAALEAGAQLVMFPKNHHVGQSRYGRMQDAFLLAGKELGLPMETKIHPGGSTSYAVLEHPRLRITLASVQKYKKNPPLHPFRRGTAVASHRPWQLELLRNIPPADNNQVVATFVFGFERNNPITPSFLEARFVSGDHYVNDCLDLLNLLKQAQTPAVEKVPGTQTPPLRKQKNFGIES